MTLLDFSQWFVQERIKKGLSQTDIAKLMDYSRSIVGNVENGVRLPTRPFVISAAYALGYDIQQTLDFSGLGKYPRSDPPELFRMADFTDLSEEQYEAIMAFKDLLKEKEYLLGPRPKQIDIDSSKPYIFKISDGERT